MSGKNPEMVDKIRRELNELNSSISKMMELFRQIKQPIQESSEKVPNTTMQLEKVTQQTEKATHKVLDIIESITGRETEIMKLSHQINSIIEARALDFPEVRSILDKIQEKADENLQDTMVIMEALQFQDITSQQIDHAVSQLEDVEAKLKTLLVTTGMVKQSDVSQNGKKARAFDPNASYDSNHQSQQQEIDNLISTINKNS